MTFDVKVHGRPVACRPGDTVLDAVRAAGVEVPTLCHDDRLAPNGACRACLVGVEGRGAVPSCSTPAEPGMEIDPADPEAVAAARTVVEMALGLCPDAAPGGPGPPSRLREVASMVGLTGSRFEARPAGEPDLSHPYIRYDPAACIGCTLCVRACDEIQGAFALGMVGRGDLVRMAPGPSTWAESDCEGCGVCVPLCPTHALGDVFSEPGKAERTETTCGYCGVGCALAVESRNGAVASVVAADGPANRGHACVKGVFTHGFAASPDRLSTPLLRIDGELREASWDEALGTLADGLAAIVAEHGPDAVGGISSSRATNEENYLFQRLMRAALGTNNVDNCARVCHAPTSFGLLWSLGESGGTNPFSDLEHAEAVLLVGANPEEAHPVVGARLRQAALRGVPTVVVDPRRIGLAELADVHLQIRPGTNVAAFNGLAAALVRQGLVDSAFVEDRVEGWNGLLGHLEDWPVSRAAEICGVSEGALMEAARLYGEAGAASIVYGLGVSQHAHGSDGVRALANLALLTGNLGRPGTGVNPLRGQNNVQGASDMGTLPNAFTLYRPVTDDAVRGAFEDEWGVGLPAVPGMRTIEMVRAAYEGRLKALVCFAEDIAQTDPHSDFVRAALARVDLLAVIDIFPTATTNLADVVLPGACFFEKEGTFTNAERRVQRVRKCVEPPGAARGEIDTVADLSRRLGHDMGTPTAAEVMDEIARLTPGMAGLSHARLDREGGLQWPVREADGPDTPRLFADGAFSRPGGKARLFAADWLPPGEEADAEFPLVLVTGRRLEHYCSGSMTRRTPNLDLLPAETLEMAPVDAATGRLADGEEVEVASRRGSIRCALAVSDRVAPGTVFLSFHFPEALTNRLLGDSLDEHAGCPEYKVSAVRVTSA